MVLFSSVLTVGHEYFGTDMATEGKAQAAGYIVVHSGRRALDQRHSLPVPTRNLSQLEAAQGQRH